MEFIIAVLPVILLAIYFYNKDIDKEPKKLLLKIFGFEMVFTIIIAMFLEIYLGAKVPLSNEIEELVYYIFIIGMVEEGTKLFSAFIFGMRSKYYNSYYDAIIYCVFAALGFAGIENIMYVCQNGILTGILRAFLAVPGHILYGALMGSFMGLATTKKRQKNLPLAIFYTLIGLLTVSILHGLYDFVLTAWNIPAILTVLTIEIILAVFTIKFINKISNIDSFAIEKDIYIGFVIKVMVTTLISLSIVTLCINIFESDFDFEDGKYLINDEIITQEANIKVNSFEFVNINDSEETKGEYLKVNITITNNSLNEIPLENIKLSLQDRDGEYVYSNVSIYTNSNTSKIINPNDTLNQDFYIKVDDEITDSSRLRLTIKDCINETNCEKYKVNLTN